MPITGDEPRRTWKREPRVSYRWRFLVNKNLHVLQKQARKLSPLKLETTNLFHQVKQKKKQPLHEYVGGVTAQEEEIRAAGDVRHRVNKLLNQVL